MGWHELPNTELFPADPIVAGPELEEPPDPPAPIVTGTVPLAFASTCLKPPAPAPPPLLAPPPPPPPTTKVSTTLVPGCNETHPVEVLDVTVHFPKEVTFLLPIIPPLVLGI
jgi:hypothetical protein